jgi:hypothetical protein
MGIRFAEAMLDNEDWRWWTWSGSNRRPLPCHGSALPAAPQAHGKDYPIFMEQERFVNETQGAVSALLCSRESGPAARWQPQAAKMHRPGHMSLTRVSLALLTATFCWSVSAQTAPAPADPPISASNALRPALAQISRTLGEISIKHWKAPGDVKSAADQDVSSIERDLAGTLSSLMQQADANPGSVPAAFAVYRNVDALYDTLLRVVLTANLAAPDTDANSLQAALSTLESARSTLGDSILNASQSQQSELVKIRTALARAAAVQRAPVTTTVVDDGPAPETTKHKHTTKKPSNPSSNPQ